MVKEIEVSKYECPYCQNIYDTYTEAEQCRDDCTEMESIEEVNEVFYQCEYCLKNHDEQDAAEECEACHIKNKDKHFFNGTDRMNKEKLARAAKHPSQKRL